MLSRAFIAGFLIFATTPVLTAKERILVNRIGPFESTLFIAKADGSDERPLLANSGFDYNASFSSDGKWIVFTSERNGSADIYRVRTDGTGLERLTDDPAYDDQAVLSPDGEQLAFVSTRGTGTADIWLLDLKTGKARNLTNGSGGNFRPSWSPDGEWFAFSSDRNTPVQRAAGRWEQLQEASIYLIRRDGTGLRRLTPPGRFAGSPRWSPDGKRVVFYDMDVKDTFAARLNVPGSVAPISQIISMDLVTGVREEHTSGAGLKVSPQFVGAGRVGYVVKEGPHTGLAFTTGEPAAAGETRNPSWSPDGKWVVYQKYSSLAWPQDKTLFSRDPEFDLVYSDPFPAFSRDGKKLALSDKLGSTAPGALVALSIMDPDGSNVKRIFHDKDALVVMPEWSPDGDRIAFGAGYYFVNRTKPAKLLMIHPDGSELHELTSGPANTGFPSWSPDGKRIVYRVWSESERGLRIINLEDRSTTTLTTGYDNFPAWSPRGDVIAFTSFRGGDFDIYTIRPDGTSLRRLTTAPGNDAHPVWSPDGDHILFSSSRLGFKDEAPLYDDVPQPYAELFVMNADGSGQRPLTDNQWEEGTPAWEPHVGALATKPAAQAVASQVTPVPNLEHSQTSAEKYIRDSEAQWAEAVANGDVSVVQRILADDYIGVDAGDGHLYDKAEAVSFIREHHSEFISNHVNDVKVRFFSNTAVAQGSESWERRTGEPRRGRFVWTDTWLLRNGNWQIAAAEDMIASPLSANRAGASNEPYAIVGSNEAQIKALYDRWARAFEARDIDGIMSIYATGDEVVAYDVLSPLQYKGKEAYRKDYLEFLAQYDGPIHVEYRDMRILSSGDVGVIHALERFTGKLTNGQQSDMWLRATSGLRKIDGKWFIVHDHVSVPVDFQTGKAALELKP